MSLPYTRAPHKHEGTLASGAPEGHAALLIDFDNVTMGMRSDLSKELKSLLNSDVIKGKVTVQRAYADWRRYPQYIVPLSENSVDLIFAPAYGSSKKNATDIRMAIDGMELIFTRPEISTYILLTGDSDFSSLVLKLKEYGKYVIGVGIQESTSDILVQNCDEYYSYTSLAGLRKSSEIAAGTAIDPWILVEKALSQMAQRKDVMRSDRLKQVMVEMDPGFDEKSFGFSKFSRFLAEASSRGLVRLKKLDNGQYEVSPTSRGRGDAGSGESRPSSRSRAGEDRGGRGRKNGGRRPDRRRDDADSDVEELVEVDGDRVQAAYQVLRGAVEKASGGSGKAVRDSDVKRKMLEADRSFDETELGFAKFSVFLKRAEDDGVVRLQKSEGGNFMVTLAGSAPAPEKRAAREPEAPAAQPQPRGEREETPEPSSLLGGFLSRFRPRQPKTTRAEPAATPAPEPTPEPRVEPQAEPQPSAQEPRSQPRRDEPRRERKSEPRREQRQGSRAEPRSGSGKDARGESKRETRPEPKRETRPEPKQEARRESRPERKEEPRGGRPRQEARDRGGLQEPEPAPTPSGSVDAGALGLPSAPGAIERYLTNRYKGVGDKTAEALVQAFGADLFNVLQDSPERALEVVPGARGEKVLAAWREDYGRRTGQSTPQADAAGVKETPSEAAPPAGEAEVEPAIEDTTPAETAAEESAETAAELATADEPTPAESEAAAAEVPAEAAVEVPDTEPVEAAEESADVEADAATEEIAADASGEPDEKAEPEPTKAPVRSGPPVAVDPSEIELPDDAERSPLRGRRSRGRGR
jgi:uncharacterized protein (TIGR00288 family)